MDAEGTWGAPASISEDEIDDVLESHRAWIAPERARQVPRLRLDAHSVSAYEAGRAARELVAIVAEDEAAALGVRVGRVEVRDDRSQWGSCSPRGTLRFNWRLALAPIEALDYVVVHEHCHLPVPNHSRRFWRHVESRRPGWRAQRDWLCAHVEELLAFRPAA